MSSIISYTKKPWRYEDKSQRKLLHLCNYWTEKIKMSLKHWIKFLGFLPRSNICWKFKARVSLLHALARIVLLWPFTGHFKIRMSRYGMSETFLSFEDFKWQHFRQCRGSISPKVKLWLTGLIMVITDDTSKIKLPSSFSCIHTKHFHIAWQVSAANN